MLIANKKIYLGLFFTCLATLMFELLMPRIWSVSMWYHFAFVAISVGMLGITGGALFVYIAPKYFSDDKCPRALAIASFLFSLSIVFSLLTQLCIPFFPDRSITGLYSLTLILIIASLPFWFSGLCVALILSKYAKQAGKLYSVDLLGAALGCLLVLLILKLTDGPTAVIASAALAAIGSISFALNTSSKKLTRACYLLFAVLIFFVAGNTVLADKQSSLIRLIWVKATFEARPLYEKWNSFSRVTVSGEADKLQEPFGWGFSSDFKATHKTRQLGICMDAFNATMLSHFTGNFNEVDYLKSDITNIAHYLRHNASILIVGTGGGRDILSALAFQQKPIVGVEINENVIAVVTKHFADFSGHLDHYPQVKFINDEARSYIARQNSRFDIIQMSLIDTASTTASGAIALTENSLYTKEAWKVFLQKLNPGGIISCTRWYFPSLPAEAYRLTNLAASALKDAGIADPSKCLVVITPTVSNDDKDGSRVFTLLASNRPFSQDDLKALKDTAKSLHFEILLCPDCNSNPILLTIAKQENLASLQASLPIIIDAPTDNNPFFFYFLKPSAPIHPSLLGEAADQLYGKAQLVVYQLLIAVSVLSFLGITCPLLLSNNKKMDFWQGLPLLGYFASIGFGFMLIEVSQMQRLIIFLGHPSYSLSVVLFTLLLAGGLGSYLTYFLNNASRKINPALVIACLIACLMVFAMQSPGVLNHYADATTPLRCLIAALLIAPIGFLMGMAVPLGINVATRGKTELIPWLWAVNGAASVVASVMAVAIAIIFGITQAYLIGVAFYVLAALLIAKESYSRPVI